MNGLRNYDLGVNLILRLLTGNHHHPCIPAQE
jgi:hypothetical protein